VPDAKQSVIRFGYPALAQTDKDFYPAVVMNYILGGGGFASQLTQQLREGKGYTYGINSNFSGTKSPGPFTISSGVRANVTLESAQLIKEILQNYPGKISRKQIWKRPRAFSSKATREPLKLSGAKLNMLENISKYGWKYDYVKERERADRFWARRI
jgi:zinc protease